MGGGWWATTPVLGGRSPSIPTASNLGLGVSILLAANCLWSLEAMCNESFLWSNLFQFVVWMLANAQAIDWRWVATLFGLSMGKLPYLARGQRPARSPHLYKKYKQANATLSLQLAGPSPSMKSWYLNFVQRSRHYRGLKTNKTTEITKISLKITITLLIQETLKYI